MNEFLTEEIEASQLKKISVRGGAVTAISQGVKFLMRLVAQITIARLLLPSDYGLVAMIAPLLSLIMLLADLGLGQAVIQQASITRPQLSALFWLNSMVNVGIAVTAAACAPLMAWIYHEPRLVGITLIAAAMVPVAGLGTQHFALLTRNVKFRSLAILDMIAPIASLAIGLVTAYSGWGYWALLASQAAESVVSVIGAWALTGWIPGPPRLEPGIRSILKVGGHITGTNLATYVTSTADNVILGLFGGDRLLGLYDKGYKTVTLPLGQLLAPFNRVAVPLLIRMQDEPQRYKSAYLNMLELILLLIWPGVVMGGVIATPLFALLLGPRWTGIGPIISWLCFGAMASPFYSSTYWLFFTQGRTASQMNYGIFLAIISVAGFVAGLPWGATGVAAGAGISFALLGAPMVILGATREGPVTRADLGVILVPFLVAAAAVLGATYVAVSKLQIQGVAIFAVVPIGYLLFAIVLYCFPEGRRALRGIVRLRHQFKSSIPLEG